MFEKLFRYLLFYLISKYSFIRFLFIIFLLSKFNCNYVFFIFFGVSLLLIDDTKSIFVHRFLNFEKLNDSKLLNMDKIIFIVSYFFHISYISIFVFSDCQSNLHHRSEDHFVLQLEMFSIKWSGPLFIPLVRSSFAVKGRNTFFRRNRGDRLSEQREAT